MVNREMCVKIEVGEYMVFGDIVSSDCHLLLLLLQYIDTMYGRP